MNKSIRIMIAFLPLLPFIFLILYKIILKKKFTTEVSLMIVPWVVGFTFILWGLPAVFLKEFHFRMGVFYGNQAVLFGTIFTILGVIVIGKFSIFKNVKQSGSSKTISNGRRRQQVNVNNIDQMENALHALLSRTNTDAFVIIQETETKKFVQFAMTGYEQLLLNLPLQTLNTQELEKAKILFKEYGIEMTKSSQKEFNMDLGNDIKKAAFIAQRILKEVYSFPDNFILKVEEN